MFLGMKEEEVERGWKKGGDVGWSRERGAGVCGKRIGKWIDDRVERVKRCRGTGGEQRVCSAGTFVLF